MLACKLACHGRVAYLCRVFGCSEELVNRGVREIKELPNDPVAECIRVPGGGRKKQEERQPEIINQVQDCLRGRTAGDPR